MIDSKNINDIVKKLMDSLPAGIVDLPKELEKNFHSVLQSALTKMDLVTREEFDAQTAVLSRTRTKLERLERQVQELEQQKELKK